MEKVVARLIIVLALIRAGTLIAQSPDDQLVRGAVNIRYLEHLVKTKADSVRRNHNLNALRNDSILYVAAADHAAYLKERSILTHYEKDISVKETPAQRVKFHGGSNFSGLGENILFTYGFIPIKKKDGGIEVNSTYDQLAFDMVDSWVHSPPHYKNLITPTYQLTGVAVSYDFENDKFYAVQLFGMIPGHDYGVESKKYFSYSDYQPPAVINGFDQVSKEEHQEYHNWKLRRPTDSLSQCWDCEVNLFGNSSTKLEVKNGNIMFCTEDTELMKLLLDEKTDALAAEIVSYVPVDCGNPAYYTNPSRRNGQCIHNGRTLKPVYRKKAKRAFKKRKPIEFMQRYRNARADAANEYGRGRKWKAWRRNFYYPFHAEFFQINLGKYPKDLGSVYYEINVLIIQKNRLCRVIHFTEFCGADWDVRPVLSDITEFSNDSFAFNPKILSARFTVPFEKGKTEYRIEDIQPVLDSVGAGSGRVLEVKISAYASVEGNEQVNRDLQQRRAMSILQALQSKQKDSIVYHITAADNWVLFDKQVKSVPAFAIFKTKTREEVKEMLKDTALNRKLEPWLVLQRQAKIEMLVMHEVTPQTNCTWITEKWKMWIDSCAKYQDDRKRVFIDSLWDMQGYYYRCLLNGTADTSCLSQISYPPDSVFSRLYYHDAWMKRYLKDSAKINADADYYKRLMNLVMRYPDNPYFPAVYALNRRWIGGWNSDGTYYDNTVDHRIIRSWLSWIGVHAPDSLQTEMDSLEIAYHFSMVKIYRAPADTYKRDSELFWIYLRFMQDSLSDSVALSLSNYLTYYGYAELAISILEPFALRENPNHNTLMQYIRFRYVHYETDKAGAEHYYSLLLWSKGILTSKEWCSMFVGPCNISFQVLDHEATRNLYCEECNTYRNYAESPEQWKGPAPKIP